MAVRCNGEDQRERAQDVIEVLAAQAVKVRHDGVDLGAERLPLGRIGCTLRRIPMLATNYNRGHFEQNFYPASNLLDAFHIVGDIPATPVLLVDDVVDSGWTLTVLGDPLRRAGCRAVYPFALAKGTSKDG